MITRCLKIVGELWVKKMNKCKRCNHDCHCSGKEHIDEYLDVCQCGNCDCHQKAEDATYEGDGVVVDDTGECESCQ